MFKAIPFKWRLSECCQAARGRKGDVITFSHFLQLGHHGPSQMVHPVKRAHIGICQLISKYLFNPPGPG